MSPHHQSAVSTNTAATPQTDRELVRPAVFYDGGCPLCRREIAHYRRIDRSGRICWIDAATDHEALARHGLSLEQAMAELHVLDTTGAWRRGLDAFITIWTHLPPYRWLARLAGLPGLKQVLAVAYRLFARWRYRRRCGSDGCTIEQSVREP
jgi:predicted DCC family thiol-disulfide oxidoreductase YuxK